LHLFGRQDPEKKGGSFLSYASANLEEMVCYVNGKPQRANVEALHKESKDDTGSVVWVAADEKFFTVAAAPFPDNPPDRRCLRRAPDDLTGEVSLAFSSRTLAPAEKTIHSFVVFAGPKYREDLDQVWP